MLDSFTEISLPDNSLRAVVVKVTAANAAPVIAGGNSVVIDVAENTTAVMTVSATDADDDTLTYSIAERYDGAKFSIDPSTGALSFRTAPDFENPTSSFGGNDYYVIVEVADGNGGIDDQGIRVSVTDVGEYTPPPYTPPAPTPTEAPTEAPTETPTEAPTEAPTETPTEAPTQAPTQAPTEAPTQAPTEAPTQVPTQAPTQAPTEAPTQAPTEAPTQAPTQAPTEAPTQAPTEAPIVSTVDGTEVITEQVTETRTTTDASGNSVTTSVTTEQFTIPTVSGTRTDSTGTTTTADVPLFWGESSRTEWATTANIPNGIGLVSEGSRAPTTNQTIATALGDLFYYIDTTTPSTDTGKSNQLSGGSSFLDLLSNVSTLIVNKITLTNDSGIASNTPVTINGTANSITTSTGTSAPVEAIVIDASTLPNGSNINLQNIEFAVLVGNGIIVRGGAGANILFSGAGSQNIVLGKEDDQLYAGAGEDIVGSVSGNDTVHGEADNDMVFGGSGWDTLSGGEGSDTINGGLGYDKALQEGSKSDYSIQITNGVITMTHKTSGSIDTLKDINEIHFANNEILYVANNTLQQKILLALGHTKAEILYVPLTQLVTGTNANDTYAVATDSYGVSIDAQEGSDVLNVSGNFNDFRIEQSQTGVEITSLINGTMNELKNFESILFSDGNSILIVENVISIVGSHYPTDAIIG